MNPSSTPTPNLLPCPFCGKSEFLEVLTDAEIHESGDEAFTLDGWGVICSAAVEEGLPGGCGAQGGYQETPELAVEAWNRRAPAPVQASPAPADLVALFRNAFYAGAESQGWSDGSGCDPQIGRACDEAWEKARPALAPSPAVPVPARPMKLEAESFLPHVTCETAVLTVNAPDGLVLEIEVDPMKGEEIAYRINSFEPSLNVGGEKA